MDTQNDDEQNPTTRTQSQGDLIQPQAEDNDQPFSEPTDPITDAAVDLEVREQSGQLDSSHQATDSASDIDSHELYDEGLAGAAEAEEPNAGNSVVGYDPEQDQRRSDHE